MLQTQLIQKMLDCEKSFVNPNGLNGLSQEIIMPGSECDFTDFSLIRKFKLIEKYESFPEKLQSELYMLFGTFRYYKWDDEITDNLARWFTYIVVPGEFELWELAQKEKLNSE